MKKTLILLLSLLVSGCASSLKTFKMHNSGSPQNPPEVSELKGIPFHAPILVEVVAETTYEVVEGHEKHEHYCTSDTSSTLELFPIGDAYLLNFDSAPFGKSEFAVTFSEKGVLTGITLNSDPQLNESIEQVSGLLGTVLPFITPPKASDGTAHAQNILTPAQSDSSQTAQKIKELYCIKSGTRIKDLTQRIISPSTSHEATK